MSPDPETAVTKDQALAHAARERGRATGAGTVADRHEREAGDNPVPLRELHERMAALHRAVQRRHATAAMAWIRIAARIEQTGDDSVREGGLPSFMAALAASVDAEGATVVFLDTAISTALRSGSDEASRAALELEYLVGEGPSLDVLASGVAVARSGARLAESWPVYGPGARELGVEGVAAMPIEKAHRVLGVLTLFGASLPEDPLQVEGLFTVAASLVELLLPEGGAHPSTDAAGPWQRLYDEQLAVINQAAGMVAVQEGCSVTDALDLIGARAFAGGVSASEVANAIVDGALRLG